MDEDIRYSKIGRHLGQQGYRHDNENDTHHTFVHPKTGHMVTVSKQEYVGGHKWTQHHGEKKVASGIGHYPELKENVLPGFLNFFAESKIQGDLHNTLLHHGFYAKHDGPELSGGGKAYGHHTTGTVHTSRMGQWAIRHAGREFRGTGNSGLSAHLKGLGLYGKGMNEESLSEKEIKVKAKVKVKIEVPDEAKVKDKEVKEAYEYYAKKDMPAYNHTLQRDTKVKRGDRLKFKDSSDKSHIFTNAGGHEIGIDHDAARPEHFEKVR